MLKILRKNEGWKQNSELKFNNRNIYKSKLLNIHENYTKNYCKLLKFAQNNKYILSMYLTYVSLKITKTLKITLNYLISIQFKSVITLKKINRFFLVLGLS